MRRHFHIDLEDIPWPVNVLKFNRIVRRLEPGEDMVATLTDADVVQDLQHLIAGMSNLHADVTQSATIFRIRVSRR